jgi:hypothetical protein
LNLDELILESNGATGVPDAMARYSTQPKSESIIAIGPTAIMEVA